MTWQEDQALLLPIAAEIEADLSQRRTGDTLGTAALLQVAHGAPRRALELLTEAQRLNPQDRRLAHDAASAQIELGLKEGSKDLVEGCSYFAGTARGSRSENWHVCREALGLDPEGSPAAGADLQPAREQLIYGGPALLESRRDAKALAERGGDCSADLGLVQDTDDPALLAAGLADLRSARELYVQRRLEDAEPLFESSATKLAAVRPVLSGWAELGLAGIAASRNQIDAASARATAVLDHSAVCQCALSGQAHWLLGMAHSRRGTLEDALVEFTSATSDYERCQETENFGMGLSLQAATLHYLGDSDRAWPLRVRSLRALRAFPRSRWLATMLRDMTQGALTEGMDRLALVFQDLAVEVSEAAGDPVTRSEALVWRARTLSSLGHDDRATADLTTAASLNSSIGDRVLRSRFRADISLGLARANLAQGRVGRETLEYLDTALAFFREHKVRVSVVESLATRGKAQATLGEHAGAERAYRTALEEAAGIEEALPDELTRIYFAETVAALRSDLLRTLLARRATSQETLLAALDERKSSPHSPLARTATPDNPIVVLRRLDGDVLAWFDDGSPQPAFASASVVPRDFQSLLAGVIEEGQGEVRAFSLLLGPFAQPLQRARSLRVLADPQLGAVPVAALRPDFSAPRLGERLPIRYLLFSDSTPAADQVIPDSVLFVAGSRGSLPEAMAELLELRQLTALALAGPDVISRLDAHPVAIFSGHAVEDGRRPERSYFACDTCVPSQRVEARQLIGARFKTLRLTVLSACSTASRASQGPAVALNLARPFVARGSAVVATLTPIPDAVAARFNVLFLSQLRETRHPALAFDRTIARLRELGNSVRPYWASFAFTT